jgi:TonB family protein
MRALVLLLAFVQPRVTKPPKLDHFVEAEYPAAAKAAGVTAQVVLSIDIAADGKVDNVGVVESGGPEFDAAAIAAAKQFVFEPAEVDGVPAPVKITYKYAFTIRTEKVKLGPQVNFEGAVLDRFSKRPVAGVTVTIKDSGASAVTNDAGHFEFVDVPLGAHRVQLQAPNLVTVETEETLVAERKKSVKYLVEPREEGVDEERVVRASRVKKESFEVTIRTEEARRVPGTQGDTLKVVQNLPGVARAALGTGQIVVWGAAPQDTRVDVDGVEIPSLYHVGGYRSTVTSDLVRSIELVPGAYGADYGRGLGGLVKVETKSLPEGTHGFIAADALDASAMLTASHGPLRIGVAGRYSYLDRVLEGVVEPDIGDFFPLPRYDDYQARAELSLRKDEMLTGTFLASDDHLRRTVSSLDPGSVRTENTDGSFRRAMLRYARILPDGSSVVVTPSFGLDHNHLDTSFGAVPTRLDTDTTVLGLRAAWRRRALASLTLSVGLDAQGQSSDVSRFGSINLPPREGDIFVFGQPPGDDVNADRWSAQLADLAPFVFAEITLGRLTLVPGLRIDGFAIQVSRLTPRVGATPGIGDARLEWAADPRLAASFKLNDRVTLSVAGGIYHQSPQPEDLSAVFGTPTLGLERAMHATAGASISLTGTLHAEATAFYKALDDLILRSPAPTPALANALVQSGVGRSMGVQLLLRQELFRHFFGWLSYSLSRSERKYDGDASYRLFDFDQTHVLTLVASWERRGWGVGTRFRYATGMPRTLVTGAFYDARDDVFQPILGVHNGIRIPAFYQLDLRFDRNFTFERFALDVYLDIQNVTYRENPEEIVYNYNYTARGYITGLPTLAVAGARLSF